MSPTGWYLLSALAGLLALAGAAGVVIFGSICASRTAKWNRVRVARARAYRTRHLR